MLPGEEAGPLSGRPRNILHVACPCTATFDVIDVCAVVRVNYLRFRGKRQTVKLEGDSGWPWSGGTGARVAIGGVLVL
jgi:hypothetical protein